MNNKLMTIREMREQFDVTARTLRFYETKELLSPIREGQKRLFTKRDQARLTLIVRGKRFGFSLEDIRQFTSGEHRTNGEASAKAFGDRKGIRFDAAVLPGKPLAGPAHARLYLVKEEEDVVLPAE